MATGAVFNSAKKKLIDGSIDLDGDTISASLHTSSFVPDIDTQVFFSDITNELPTASGYTAGGVALANKSITIDTTNNRAYLDADDTTWVASGTLTARYVVLRKNTGTAATSPVIGYIDYVTDRSVISGETFKIEWAAAASGAILYLA